MTQARTASLIVFAAFCFCSFMLLCQMHANVRDNLGLQVGNCIEHNENAHIVYLHTFYTRPIMIAVRCVKG